MRGMRLHYHPLSSYSRKAALGIAVRGDAIELVQVDPFKGDLKSEAFVRMSPFGKMPVLELDDGAAVYESTSILEHLEERGPRRLLPEGKERVARHFDRLGDLYLLDPIGKYFWDKKTEGLRDKTTATLHKAWALFDAQIGAGKYVLGDAISLADLGAFVALHYAQTEGIELPKSALAYFERLREQPAFAASCEAAQPFVAATKPMREKTA
jgi:glutathione S-transferase